MLFTHCDIFTLVDSSHFSYLISITFLLQPRGGPTFGGTASLLLFFQMLEEDLEQFRGEVHLRRTESLRSTVRLQEHWAELGQTLLNRHKDSAGALSPQHTALEEITQTTCELYRQYNIRISGNNGKE